MTVKRTTVLYGVLALVVFLGSATGALGAKPAPTFTMIDVPGVFETSPREINEVGEIVGFFVDGTGTHGFLLSEGTFSTIDVPGEFGTIAYGINPEGDIVGSFGPTATRQSFLLSQGVFSTFGFPGAPRTEAFTISADGVIVGFYVSALGPVFVHGFP